MHSLLLCPVQMNLTDSTLPCRYVIDDILFACIVYVQLQAYYVCHHEEHNTVSSIVQELAAIGSVHTCVTLSPVQGLSA